MHVIIVLTVYCSMRVIIVLAIVRSACGTVGLWDCGWEGWGGLAVISCTYNTCQLIMYTHTLQIHASTHSHIHTQTHKHTHMHMHTHARTCTHAEASQLYRPCDLYDPSHPLFSRVYVGAQGSFPSTEFSTPAWLTVRGLQQRVALTQLARCQMLDAG